MPDIIVNDVTPRNQYTAGGGGPTVFAFTFPIFSPTDLSVYSTPVGVAANDAAQVLVYNVGYTVTNNVAPAVGGTITLTTPANAGDIITIVNNQPYDYLHNFIPGGLFEATDVNTDFDRSVLMSQQDKMYDRVLGIHYNNCDVINTNNVPPLNGVDNVLPVLPPNCLWVKNNANTAIVAVQNAGGGGGAGGGVVLPSIPGRIAVFMNAAGVIQSGLFSLPIADGDNGDAITTNGAGQLQTTTIPGNNRLVNGDMQVWQRGAGGTATFAVAGGANAYTADRWQMVAGVATNVTVSQQPGATSGSYFARVQRDAANAGTNPIVLGQTLTRSSSIGAAGKFLTLSFTAYAGANYSAGANALSAHIVTGTGTTDVSAFTTGFVGTTTLIANPVILTGAAQRFAVTTSVAIPANITQLAVYFGYNGAGVAGANDWFQVSDVQLEVSKTASPFQRLSFWEQIMRCFPYYRKSFDYGTVPAQNVGAASHEYIFAATVAAAGGNVVPKIIFEPPMLSSVAITYFNPAAANALIRDITAGVDFGTTTTQNINTGGVSIVGNSNGATTVGNLCGIHYTLDADLTQGVVMPFKSKAQRKFMYSQNPELAKEFEAATPKGKKLPEHVKKGKKK